MRNFLLLFCFSPLLSFAQRSMNEYYQMSSLSHGLEMNYYENSVVNLALRKKLHIQQVHTVRTNAKGKKNEATYTYNVQGRLTQYTTKKFKMVKEYENDTVEVKIHTQNDGKEYEVESTYSDGMLVKREFFKNKKQTHSIELLYTDFKKVSVSRMKKGRKTFEIAHTYNADKKIIRTAYSMNGKLEKEWIYECKPEGEVVASKNTAIASVCSFREESADGSYAVFTRTLLDGIPYLNKQVFSKDSVLTLIQSFYKDSILTWERKIEPLVETTIQYKKSGKFYTKNILQKDAEGNVISSMYFYKRLNEPLSHRIYSLNANGSVQTEQLYYKQKLRYSVAYQFRYF